MSEEQDPFDVFGDDEDSDADESNVDTFTAGQKLVEQANARLQQLGTGSKSSTSEGQKLPPDVARPVEVDSTILSHLKTLEIQWPPPMYLGPIVLVSELPFGGGRGYVASRNLDAGTLVLVEEPMLEWPPEQLGNKLDLISVLHILENPNATQIVNDIEEFHPTKKDVDNIHDNSGDPDFRTQVSDMVQSLRQELPQEAVNKLVDVAKDRGIHSRDTSPIEAIDILRMFLALRYNGYVRCEGRAVQSLRCKKETDKLCVSV